MSTFKKVFEKFNSTDKYEQGEAPELLFQEWYQYARSFAKTGEGGSKMLEITRDAFSILLGIHPSGKATLQNFTTDDYVVRACCDNISKLCTIFREKPKFTKLLESDPQTISWFANTPLRTLLSCSCDNRLPQDNAIECLHALKSFLSLGNVNIILQTACSATLSESKSSALRALATLATSSATESLLREAAADSLELAAFCAGKGSVDGNIIESISLLLIERAEDEAAISRALRLGALNSTRCVALLKRRATSSRRLMPTVLGALMESLRNSMSEGKLQHNGKKPMAIDLEGKHAVPLCNVIAACDVPVSMDAEIDGTVAEGGARQEAVLELLETLIEAREPQCSEAVVAARGKYGVVVDSKMNAVASSHDVNVAVASYATPSKIDDTIVEGKVVAVESEGEGSGSGSGSSNSNGMIVAPFVRLLLRDSWGSDMPTLNCATGMASRFSRVTWLEVTLPFIRRRLAEMGTGGVSGIEWEQEVINLLREGLRLYYLSGLSSTNSYQPTQELGHVFFKACIAAINCGYIETERFPELAARVLLRHAPTSVSWLTDVLWKSSGGQDHVNKEGKEIERKRSRFDKEGKYNSNDRGDGTTSHRTRRALVEMCLQFLGVGARAGGFGGEIATPVTTGAGRGGDHSAPDESGIGRLRLGESSRIEALEHLACVRTEAAEATWIELAKDHGAFLVRLPTALDALLASIGDEVSKMESVMMDMRQDNLNSSTLSEKEKKEMREREGKTKNLAYDGRRLKQRLAQLATLLRELANCADCLTPRLAPELFALATRIIVCAKSIDEIEYDNALANREEKLHGISEATDERYYALIPDKTLRLILCEIRETRDLPSNVLIQLELCLNVAEAASLSGGADAAEIDLICGPLSRIELARLYPLRCLGDCHPAVRAAALCNLGKKLKSNEISKKELSVHALTVLRAAKGEPGIANVGISATASPQTVWPEENAAASYQIAAGLLHQRRKYGTDYFASRGYSDAVLEIDTLESAAIALGYICLVDQESCEDALLLLVRGAKVQADAKGGIQAKAGGTGAGIRRHNDIAAGILCASQPPAEGVFKEALEMVVLEGGTKIEQFAKKIVSKSSVKSQSEKRNHRLLCERLQRASAVWESLLQKAIENDKSAATVVHAMPAKKTQIVPKAKAMENNEEKLPVAMVVREEKHLEGKERSESKEIIRQAREAQQRRNEARRIELISNCMPVAPEGKVTEIQSVDREQNEGKEKEEKIATLT